MTNMATFGRTNDEYGYDEYDHEVEPVGLSTQQSLSSTSSRSSTSLHRQKSHGMSLR